jgi:hypothetical protein
VADHRGDLAGLVEGGEQPRDALVACERVHRPLAADEKDRVVVGDRHVGERDRLLDQLRVLGGVDEAEAEQVVGGVAGLVAWVAPRIGLEPAAVGARDVDPVAAFGQLPVGVGELGPPEADRPAGRLRDGGVGRDDEDALGSVGPEDVDRCGHALEATCGVCSPNTDRVCLYTAAV